MNKALPDTDIYSEVLKAVNPTVARYRQLHGVYSLSVITVIEVVTGFQWIQNNRRLQAFLTAFASEEAIPLAQAEAELAGRIVGDLARTGQLIGWTDPLIAAIALEHEMDLVTGNTAHFQRIQLA